MVTIFKKISFRSLHFRYFQRRIIVFDFFHSGEDDISWGDILRIASGIFLALNNLAQELIVKTIDSVEYLGMIGFLGSLISGLQT